MTRLAVYGTLKQGNYNHQVHLDQNPVFSDFVEIKAEMYTNGRYPMLVKSDKYHKIFVEIYKINTSTLKVIDQLEEPFGYHREEVSVNGFDDFWIYFYGAENPPQEFTRVKNGNFVKEREW